PGDKVGPRLAEDFGDEVAAVTLAAVLGVDLQVDQANAVMSVAAPEPAHVPRRGVGQLALVGTGEQAVAGRTELADGQRVPPVAWQRVVDGLKPRQAADQD